jgi:ankyrin repeat protein
VQSLLDGGANINEAVDTYGQTIFHEVARSWNLDVAAFLLKNGRSIFLIFQNPTLYKITRRVVVHVVIPAK